MLPSIDPMETIYSWGCKTRIALALSARQLNMNLFGSFHAGKSYELPSCLEHVEQTAKVSLGDVSTLVRRHTVFSAYLALVDSARAKQVEMALYCGQMMRARALLGLRTNKFGSRHPLRYCRDCAEEDRRHLGYSRWKTDHQLPGARPNFCV